MHLVQLEHPVRDFEAWKAAFDRDPVRREASGVRRYQIFRPIDDTSFVAIDLEFDSRTAAEAFTRALEELWRSPQATAALAGTPRVRVVDVVETKVYQGQPSGGLDPEALVEPGRGALQIRPT